MRYQQIEAGTRPHLRENGSNLHRRRAKIDADLRDEMAAYHRRRFQLRGKSLECDYSAAWDFMLRACCPTN